MDVGPFNSAALRSGYDSLLSLPAVAGEVFGVGRWILIQGASENLAGKLAVL